MLLTQAVETFLGHRQLKGCAASTLSLYERQISAWIAWRGDAGGSNLADVQIDELRAYLLYLQHEHIPHGHNPRRPATDRRGVKPASQDTTWRILRSFWLFLEREELLSSSQERFFRNDRIPRPKVSRRARPFCDRDTLDALVDAAGDGHDEESARNRAMVLMLYESGLRVSELAALTDAVDLVGRRARIIGKGDKERWVFWGSRTATALQRYLFLRRDTLNAALFRGVSSRNNGGPLTADAIRGMVCRLGVDLPPGAPVHFLRHGFAHACIDAGLDRSQVQQLMGHASPATTDGYLLERPERLQELHKQVFVGGKKRRVS